MECLGGILRERLHMRVSGGGPGCGCACVCLGVCLGVCMLEFLCTMVECMSVRESMPVCFNFVIAEI